MDDVTYLARRLERLERAAVGLVLREGVVRQTGTPLIQLDDDTDAAGKPARKLVGVGTLTLGQRVLVLVSGGFDRIVIGRLT